METESLYAENIMDHYNNPRNHGTMENANLHIRELNPLCGDEIEMYAKISDEVIQDISFTGKGCAISQAAASILTEEAKGKRVEEIKGMSNEDMIKLLGIQISPVRLKCALLALKTLQRGMKC